LVTETIKNFGISGFIPFNSQEVVVKFAAT
jgi:hypothetical protein